MIPWGKRLALLVATMGCGTASALCPVPPERACRAWFRSDQVFVGTVLAIHTEPDSRDPNVDWLVYRLRVQRPLKGSAAATAEIRTENASGRWIGDVGKTYVVFAKGGEVGSACSAIDDADAVESTLREIEGIKSANRATIEGEVVDFENQRPQPATAVRIRSGARLITARTDSNGRFRVVVPPGRYSIVEPRYSTWNDARDFKLQAGECGLFQLETRQRPERP